MPWATINQAVKVVATNAKKEKILAFLKLGTRVMKVATPPNTRAQSLHQKKKQNQNIYNNIRNKLEGNHRYYFAASLAKTDVCCFKHATI